ncbi:ATP-grasp domain-containing protein [Pseudoalteromonas rubra]|uniref:ATP-grasp domain-containing protein n=1 Tax=Pseudoalteromonas rubra TaxID=43658 RepID=UPI002DBDFA2C|nr:ATP-grasp domain-containing protein [Pseudoalteromonas rubra]MEC4091420.1 ATP-grasp domain-containing protein [Pseudoalteromonas rubra]
MLDKYQQNGSKVLLYLDTRELPLERKQEIAAAKQQGYKILMATPTPRAYDAYCLDYVLDVNVGNFAEAEPVILDYIATHKLNVTGILVWKDREVVLASKLGQALGLPHTTPEHAENVRDKSKTRALLEKFPGLNPRFSVVRDEASFMSGLAEVGVPAVLKQAGNSGSRGMCVITDLETALDKYREVVAVNKQQAGDMYHYYEDIMLLEQRLIGSEHSLAGVVADGEVITFTIADKKFDTSLPLQYENVVPSKLAVDLQTEIVAQLKQAVAETGINWCGFHVDFMITEAGLKILEIGGRLGGEMINSHLIPLTLPGVSSYAALIEVVQGNNPLAHTDYTQLAHSRVASRVVMPTAKGVISKIEGVQNVIKDPRCREFMQTWGVGDEMVYPDVKFKGYEIGYFIAQVGLDDDIEQAIEALNNKITITIE